MLNPKICQDVIFIFISYLDANKKKERSSTIHILYKTCISC